MVSQSLGFSINPKAMLSFRPLSGFMVSQFSINPKAMLTGFLSFRPLSGFMVSQLNLRVFHKP